MRRLRRPGRRGAAGRRGSLSPAGRHLPAGRCDGALGLARDGDLMEWIYGRNVVELALAAGARRRAYRLAATAPALRALRATVPARLPVERLDTHALDALTGSRDHQGIALQVDAYPYAASGQLVGAELVVVLDEVSDPRNLGAVARSALAAGANGLVVPRHRAAAVTPAAVKASAGTVEHLAVAQVTNIVSFLGQAKDAGAWVYGAAGDAPLGYLDLDLTGRVVIVLGAEGRGLRPLVARTCDLLASIPLRAPVESLNVSVAAALFLFEARRQRDAARARGSATGAPSGPGVPSGSPSASGPGVPSGPGSPSASGPSATGGPATSPRRAGTL